MDSLFSRGLSLADVAHQLVPQGRGIFVTDESPHQLESSMHAAGLHANREMRHAWRNLIATTPGLSNTISAVILHEWLLEDANLRNLFADSGVSLIVRLDAGMKKLNERGGQIATVIDGLDEILPFAKEVGAVGTKFRSLFRILDEQTPTDDCYYKNAAIQARLARLSQDAGLVPIVELEFGVEGMHSLEVCKESTGRMLDMVFSALRDQKIDFNAMILSTSMVLSGKQAPVRASPMQVAEATLSVLKDKVPPSIPGVVFLAGSQGETEFLENLNAISNLAFEKRAPWQLTYAAGSAFQDSVLAIWAHTQDEGTAGHALSEKLNRAHLAQQGRYVVLPDH